MLVKVIITLLLTKQINKALGSDVLEAEQALPALERQ